MKRTLQKKLIELAQRQQAQLDYALGRPQRKKSATYEHAYSEAYALDQIPSVYPWDNDEMAVF